MKNFRRVSVFTLGFLVQGFICHSGFAQDFYPLQVGNLWQYEVTFQGESEGYYTVEISKDTVMSNGKRYYGYGTAFCRSGFQRIDDSLNIYQYDDLFHNLDGDSSTDEVLFDKLNSQIGDFWLGYRYSYSPGRPTYSKNEGYYYTTWFDTEVTVIQVAYYSYAYGGPGFFAGRIQYSSKFGITYAGVEGGVSYELRGAKIGGVVYGTIVGVPEKKEVIPEQFRVLEPYPNPFNASTTVEYELSEEGTVSIKIYGILGNLVKSFDAGRKSPGRYSLRWDLLDSTGKKLPSGTYFLQVTHANKIIVKKLLAIL